MMDGKDSVRRWCDGGGRVENVVMDNSRSGGVVAGAVPSARTEIQWRLSRGGRVVGQSRLRMGDPGRMGAVLRGLQGGVTGFRGRVSASIAAA